MTDKPAGPMVQPPLLLLVGISAIGPTALNGVLPANTAVMHELATSYGMAQMVLTVYLVATMISQLLLGNLADRIGRRPVMIGSLLVFGVGGIFCALSTSIEALLLGRFIQGLGSSVCLFLTRTIMRDVHSKDKAASKIGYMNTAMMVAPLVGPAIFGWITDVSSWRIMYGVLAVAGLSFSWLSYRYQNETLNNPGQHQSNFIADSTTLLASAEYRSYLGILCGSVGIYFCFLAGAPYVVMELRGHNASTYGMWFAMVAIGYLLGNFTAGRLSQRLGTQRMIGLSIVPIVLGITLFWLLSGWSNLVALFLPMQLIAFSNGICMPNLTSASMSVRPELAGTASGLSGTVQVASAIGLTLVVSVLLNQSELPLFAAMTLCAIVCIAGYLRLRQTGPAASEV